MKFLKKIIFPILFATVWISISEFARNQFILKSYWIGKYTSLGLTFPSAPINGGVWGVWSLLFAIAIFLISKKFSLLHTTLLSWFVAFVLMWVVIWNMGFLPNGILFIAVPLSLFESFLASLIIKKLTKTNV